MNEIIYGRNWFANDNGEFYNGEKVRESHPPKWCIVERSESEFLCHYKGQEDTVAETLDAAFNHVGLR